jgi:hypothetical protein
VPVVYDGRIRIVEPDVVLADVDRLTEMGAEHVTFGDPDFLNGPHHSMRVVRELHRRHPGITFDITTKVEHILRHRGIWDELAALGCRFVVSAFETLDDAILVRLDKGHVAADLPLVVELLRRSGIEVRPSWMPFTPWTTVKGVDAILSFVAEHGLVANVDPVQMSLRLLIPEGSLMLAVPDLAPYLENYDAERLTYRWRSADPAVDRLQREIATAVAQDADIKEDPVLTLSKVAEVVSRYTGRPAVRFSPAGREVPRLSEPWFCCAEPTEGQLAGLRP